jgi:hypothetical protein
MVKHQCLPTHLKHGWHWAIGRTRTRCHCSAEPSVKSPLSHQLGEKQLVSFVLRVRVAVSCLRHLFTVDTGWRHVRPSRCDLIAALNLCGLMELCL